MTLKSLQSLRRNDLSFIACTLVIFILGIFNVAYKFRWKRDGFESAENLWNPSWLLFGPLIYFGLLIIRDKFRPRLIYLLHFIPFFFFLVFFLIAFFSYDVNDPWKSVAFTYYQNIYCVIILSLLPYSIIILTNMMSVQGDAFTQSEILLAILSCIYIVISVIVALVYYAWGIVHINMGIDYRYFSYIFLIFGNIAIAWYWLFSPSTLQKHSLENTPVYKHSELSKEDAHRYRTMILSYMEHSKIYLKANLTLEIFSEGVNISKHHLSQIFSVHFEKNFHSFLAEYRIKHAISLMHDNHFKLTIESIANSCGFNSKTSFNKYFKDYTGLSPYAYQENIINSKND